ncbi:EmrB/QacA subfamily drug resistance transporter [Corynebacterium suranareeae]|uniref:EmrB/QacA subfamily drug resistance transporter n=1 Tax=Corynebacterium suranareeae TaxID=2506452 RepID=A0A169S3B6_9CORY|nr:MFS transporter [Corynebacterium suranareeae]BAU97028.1 EmrB/QacA subfamily drug resistance transporter [Corynebacterium suranareeae]
MTHTPTPAFSKTRIAWMIAVAAAAAFLATFNETFLNVAFTPIMQDFNVDVNTVQWLTTGYLLVAAVFVPVSNILYHRFPTKPLFVSVVALMLVGSIVGALAPSFEVLLIARLLQAIGTGLLTPIGMNITLAVSPREKLGLNMGIMAAMTTLGPSLAIVLSGALLTVAPWTTLLWVFGGLTLVVLLAGGFALQNVAALRRPVLDTISFLLVAIGLVGILYGVSAAFGGAALYAAISAVIGVVALWIFVIRQQRIEHPLLNLRPFANISFVLGVLMTMLGLLFVFAMNVVIPLFLQSGHQMEPLGASLTLAPGILLTVVMGPIAGKLFDRHGGRWSIPLGFLIMAVFVTLVGVAAGHSSIWLFGTLYIPAVLATALVIGPSQTFALSQLDRETSPHGVTIVSTGFQIAGCVGTSLGAGIYGAISGGSGEFDSLLGGFRGAVGLVVVTSIIGIVLAFLAYRSTTKTPAASDQELTVQSIMKTDVYTLSLDDSVLDALKTFTDRGISGAPILHKDGTLAGFLSDGDVMRYLSATHPSSTSIYSYAIGGDDDLAQAMSELAELNVMRIATRNVLTIDAASSIVDAVTALSDAHIKKVPVVRGENGPVVGIVNRSAVNRLAIGSYLQGALVGGVEKHL